MSYKNPQKQRDKALARYYANREDILKKQITYKNKMYHTNEEFKAKRKIRDAGRQLKKNNLIYLKDKICIMCGSKKDLQRHHIKYTTNIKDILILCRKCHREIHKV